jgi:hypothetical protein
MWTCYLVMLYVNVTSLCFSIPFQDTTSTALVAEHRAW